MVYLISPWLFLSNCSWHSVYPCVLKAFSHNTYYFPEWILSVESKHSCLAFFASRSVSYRRGCHSWLSYVETCCELLGDELLLILSSNSFHWKSRSCHSALFLCHYLFAFFCLSLDRLISYKLQPPRPRSQHASEICLPPWDEWWFPEASGVCI